MCIRPLAENLNVTILTGAFVKQLETSPSGREVTAVLVERDGVEERHKSAVVVASCGAVNSAALLLRSANEKHPAGLANGFRCGRPPLYGAQQLGIRGRLEAREPHGFPKDPRRQRLLSSLR